MFHFDKKLQYPVKVETPEPVYAQSLQQVIGGIEGEIRVCMQYFFQAWGARGPTQPQWLAVIEELGGYEGKSPTPTAFRSRRSTRSSPNFFATSHDGEKAEKARYTCGPSLDGKGKYTLFQNKPLGEEPILEPARPDGMAQTR